MDLSAILEIITAAAVLLGILFGLLQLRHYHLSRKRESALFLLNSLQTVDFIQGIWIIQELPGGLSKKEIEDRIGNGVKSIYLVMSNWESVGVMVYRREISMDMVADAYADPIVVSWQRLERFVVDLRKILQRDTPFAWFQWLAERIMAREKTKPPKPAHLAHRDWKE